MVDEKELQKNAEIRRRTWEGGVSNSFQEAAEEERRFWQKATPEQRFLAIWQMADDFWKMQGNHGSLPRLQRTIGGIRKRKS